MGRIILALLVAGAMAACNGTGLRNSGTIIQAELSAEQLAQVKAPLMRLTIANFGTSALATQVASNNGVNTWKTGDNVALSFRNGVIVGSRGLGDDLMGADPGALPWQTTDWAERIHSYLNGEAQSYFTTFLCRMTDSRQATIEVGPFQRQTREITELCRTPGREITNQYWVGSDGFVWKSRQWISAGAGYVVTERLVR